MKWDVEWPASYLRAHCKSVLATLVDFIRRRAHQSFRMPLKTDKSATGASTGPLNNLLSGHYVKGCLMCGFPSILRDNPWQTSDLPPRHSVAIDIFEH